MFQAINPLKTLYKVSNTNPNYYSVVVPLNFLRNFRFVSNNPAAEEGLAENKQNNNNNHVDYSQSGIYKESSVWFLQDLLNNSIQLRASLEEELDSLCRGGKFNEAVKVVHLLKQQQTFIDEALENAKCFHEQLMRSVHIFDFNTNNKLIDMYGKCDDSMIYAWKVFNGMGDRFWNSWDIMITNLAKNGFGEEAIELFTEFKRNIGSTPDMTYLYGGLKPLTAHSEIFLGVFYACSVVGDVNEGLLHFESMSKDYDIVPSMKHYVSVVEMLASNGYLDEALEFIEKMPMEPSVDVWEVLMNLSRVHGQTVVGDRCAEIVEQLDPSRLDEFSKEGLIRVTDEDIAREEERENKKLALEDPDTQIAKLYGLLRDLRQQMKEEGYVPDVTYVLHDLDPEGKEDCVLEHSERLEVAIELVSSPARSHVWVSKSLPVCGDCYNALKIISKLVGREISVNDATGFHHFKDGVCDCNAGWCTHLNALLCHDAAQAQCLTQSP